MELDKIREFLEFHAASIVAVQVHTSIYQLSLKILNDLESSFPNVLFAIIGDSPFSSCCSDYMSAKHIAATVIIHYGHKCASPSALPVLHIQDPMDLSLVSLTESIPQLPQKLCVLGESLAKTTQVIRILQDHRKEIVEKKHAEAVIFAGNGCCVSSLIELPEQNIWTLTDSSLEFYSAYQFISKRFHYISQVPDCQVFGILISSLSTYNRIGNGLKGLLQKYNKTCYPIYLGKITPLKLGNFSEIDIFVMVSCENTPLPDNKTLYKPVITPFELEVGLKGSWTGKYSTEFHGEEYLTEKIRDPGVEERFIQREFKGLVPEFEGSLEVKEGHSGIAMGYKSEIS